MTCASDNTIAALLAGAVDAASAHRLERHLDACEACRRLVADLGRGLSALGDGTGERRSERLPHSGASLGRYQLRRVVGVGGMGVVYEAHDPRLDRRVAVKLLRPDNAEHGDTWLLAEAQAMARLRHPNIAVVYDAGAVQGQVYLCMEYVAGVTLGEWLTERPRRWRQILEIFVAAGRGLSYVHRAGIVHLDFKPDNVLIDRSGRPVVTDFGLARMLGKSGHVAGVIGGTPAYMAPEQRRGQPCDARADQHAFCAALRGALLATPSTPAWLRRALARGLADDAGDRFASMDALLAVLEAGAHRTRRRAIGITLVAAVAFAALAAARPPRIQTRVVDRPVERLIDHPVERQVERAVVDPLAAEPSTEQSPSPPEPSQPGVEPPAGVSGTAGRADEPALHVDPSERTGLPAPRDPAPYIDGGTPAVPRSRGRNERVVLVAHGCSDGSALTCLADMPDCPGSSIAAIQHGCWTCAEPATCALLGLPWRCDDGSRLRCALPRPVCSGRLVPAVRGGCWTCADPFSCSRSHAESAPGPYVREDPPRCGNARCERGEDRVSCPADCCELAEAAECTSQCGNMTCERDEDHSSCPRDCCRMDGSGECAAECGNLTCERGESRVSCPSDCCTDGSSAECAPLCGDGLCQLGEEPATCPEDCFSRCRGEVCEPMCGDRLCEQGEDAVSCPSDCRELCPGGVCEPMCGNRACEAGEDAASCPTDCR